MATKTAPTTTTLRKCPACLKTKPIPDFDLGEALCDDCLDAFDDLDPEDDEDDENDDDFAGIASEDPDFAEDFDD